MNHQEIINENGYCVFDLTKENDRDSTTPVDARYTVIVLCYEGECMIEANMHTYKIRRGDCLCVGNVMYKTTVNMSDDFRAKVIVSLSSFAFDSIVGIPTGFMESIYTKPVVNIADEGVMSIINNYIMNLDMMQSIDLGYKKSELVALAYRSVMLMMATLRGVTAKTTQVPYNQGDVYFRQFVELIDEHIKQEHEVAFYAGKLGITGKYLSEVCKLKSGHKAKEIISSFLISKIKQEMTMTGKSIKTIAYEYGFSDQSSMGKFFAKMTGMAPGDFRKSGVISTHKSDES